MSHFRYLNPCPRDVTWIYWCTFLSWVQSVVLQFTLCLGTSAAHTHLEVVPH